MNKTTIFFLLLLSSALTLPARSATYAVFAVEYQDNCIAIPDSNVFKDSIASVTHQPRERCYFTPGLIPASAPWISPGFRNFFNFCALNGAYQAQIADKQNTNSTSLVKAIYLKPAETRKWSLRSVMCSVCDYIYKGVKAKYQPPGILIADAR